MEGVPQHEKKESILYPEIASELLQMAEEDQEMRRHAQETKEWNLDVDTRNTERMKDIIEKIGWPTISKVGADAANSAWLLVQHADRDVPFQKACLELLKEQQEGEIRPANIGYLEDRVRTHEKTPQLYGTQFYTNEAGEFGPFPIEDPKHLDERRHSLNMEAFEEYKQLMFRLHGEGK